MAVLPIIETPDPRLRLISRAVEPDDRRVPGLAADMLDTMYAAPGIGLAAIQVGEPLRLVVMDLADGPDPENPRNPRVLLNPAIVESDAETLSTYNEGCLSAPDMYADIERPARVRASWTGLDGIDHDLWADGLLATCLQHEIDHLNGVMFFDHLSKLKRDMLLKRLAKLRKEKAAA